MGRVLVTGGAGYIGSHAVRALLGDGHSVVVLDDLSAGHAAAVPAGVPFVERSTHDQPGVAAALREHRIDAVMHFAAWLVVSDSVRDPLGYYANNVVGSLSLLGAMVEVGVRRLVFSSTCAVYGEPSAVPIVETIETRPINAYGETKLAVERALPHVQGAHGLEWIALRYFNAAGAHPDGTLGEDHTPEIHIIPRAIQAATGGEPLQLFGEDYPTPDGTCLRDYIHVCDLADAHVLALGALEAGHPSGAYNAGTGHPHSVKQVIETVGRVVGAPVQWTPAPRRPGDPAALYASSDRLQRELGWKPAYPELQLIVQHAWQWHRSHPHGHRSLPSA
ncbi:MAG TPA: UDP-glucose 4-epimerase GalE [Vicinamibacterales bacterium]|nr:UDP-glucose 4-epimerase GalE [Vicinamibacterales bacterium]